MKTNLSLLKKFCALAMLLVSVTSYAQFKVIGYLPTWGGNLADVQYTKLTHINYAFLIPTSTGGYQAPDDPTRLRNLVTQAHANGVKVIISVGGGGGGDAFKTIVPNSGYRTTFVNNMVSFVNQYNLDGVDIDWEFPSDGTEANNFLLLMQQLSTAMHSNGKVLTAAVIAYGGTSFVNGLFSAVDFLNIMAYDENNYDHSTYALGVQSVNYWVGRGLPAGKAVLGVPFYGRDNCCDYKTVGYNDILAMGGSPNADTYNNQIGYNGIPTIKQKTAYAMQACGGIMIWSLDTDVLGANSLLSAINQVVVANSNPVPDNLAKGKTVTVSSTEASTTTSTVGSNATDGSYATRWSSLFADPQWVSVDLGANYNVNRVKLTWESAYATAYQIQISSDGTNWTNLKSVTGNTTTTNDQTGLSGTGRYARIYGTARATAYGYSLYELEVYGTAIESPYSGTAISLPGKIEAENYDLGGQGLAYNDADAANQGGVYRTDGVDVQATTDVGGGYNVGYTADGEWMNYMVNAPTAGTYNFGFRTAGTGTTSAIRIEVDGAAVTGSIALPNTGGWQTWANTASPNITLSAGAHTIRLFTVTGGFNLNYVNVTTVITNQAPSVSLTTSGTTFTAPASVTLNATAADADGTISKVEFYNGATLLGTSTASPYSFTWNNVAIGTYSITAKATDNGGLATISTAVSITVTAPAPIETPYTGTAISLPGIVQAENYDNGGQGLAYNDIETTNQGGAFRTTEGVDIETTTDVGGGYNVGYTADGEWMKYMVNVTTTGIYNFAFRTAGTGTTSTLRLEIDGATIATLALPNTGGWQNWATTTSSNISLTAGAHTIRLFTVTGGFNLNYVNVAANQAPSVSLTTSGTSFTTPASVTLSATATDADGTVSKVEFYNGTTLLSTSTTTPYSFVWSNVAVGTYSVTAKATDNSGVATTSAAVSITVKAPVTVETPYTGTAISLPGIIQAENYDNGGQGLAYNDLETTNQGGAFRTTEGVDIETTTDIGGGYNVGYTVDGEWMKYMVNLTTTGIYNFAFRTAGTGTTSTLRLEIDGATIATLALPNTGGWQTWATTTSSNISLIAGAHTIRLFTVTGGFNLNYVNVTANQAPSVSLTTSGTSFTTPASVTLSATATDGDGTVSKVEFFNGTTLLSTSTVAPYSFVWSNVAVGTYSVTAKATDNNGAATTSSAISIAVTAPVETPYGGTAQVIPGTIQAENYDNGGEGIAYHDLEAVNQGGSYRTTDGVDIQATTDVGGGYNIGYTADGEWTNYTVNVTAAGTYDVSFRTAATSASGVIRMDIDGTNATGSVSLPNTGAWQTWTTTTVANIAFTAGTHIVRLFTVTGGFNLNSVTVSVHNTNTNPGFLHASGKNIVNDKGNFIIKAVNIGDFMIQEGYMMNLGGSQHVYRQKIADMVGTTARDQFYANYYANFITKADIDSIAKWGFNTIRLPMHYALFTPLGQPDVFLDQGFTIVDNILGWCKANNIYVILDLHAAPGGENSGDISDYDSSMPSLWESAANRDQTVKLWSKLASRYVNEQYIGGYDLINETNWTLANNNQLLAQLMKDITTAIRQVDNNHIVYIEGNSYANDYNGLTPKWDNNMVYSFHKYWNDDSQGSLNFVLAIRDGQNVPIWMGEFGENSNNWIADAVTLMNQNGIGWAIWPYKKMSSVSSISSFNQPSNWSAFADYVNGGAKPSAATGQAILNELLENVKVKNCKVNKGYLYALFQQPGNTNTAPYTSVSLPGRISAANYDEGKNGYAYNDAAFQNTQYGSTAGSSTSWNTGWYYRNDGVDLQFSSSENSPTVGWTENGDWMQYTINITTAGSYSVKVRAAGNGGTLSLSSDGTTLINNATIPSTGGWDTWQTVSLGNVNLTAGTHKLRFTINTAGYNLNYFDFANASSSARIGSTTTSNDVAAATILVPNPTTGIFTIALNNSFSVQVLNSYGLEVMSIPESAANGPIDITGLAAGVYLVKINSGGDIITQKIIKQ